jgi:hypothetical protein
VLARGALPGPALYSFAGVSLCFRWVLSYGQSAYAVGAVESFQPLFHLLNGDMCYADLNPTVQPEVWRDVGNNNQASAAFRPWMPCRATTRWSSTTGRKATPPT